MKILTACTVFAAAAGMCIATVPAPDGAQARAASRPRPEAEWELPAEESGAIVELTGSADGGVICFTVIRSRQGRPSAGGPLLTCWMLDTASGKLTNMSSLLSERLKPQPFQWYKMTPSPDGKHVLATGMLDDYSRARVIYLLTLATGEVSKVVQRSPGYAVWSTGKAYLSGVVPGGNVGPIRVWDPSGRDTVELKICGMVAAAAPDDSFLVVACDPNAPTTPLSPERVNAAPMCIVRPSGEIVARLARTNEMSRPPEISPNGEYLVFERHEWLGHRRPPRMLGMRIVSVDGRTIREISTGTPVAVTNKGEVIAAVRASDGGQTVIQRIDVEGRAVTLAPGATNAAIVRNDVLFYVTSGPDRKLKALPLTQQERTSRDR